MKNNIKKIPKTIEQAMFGFIVSHVLFTLEKLGIFDVLSSCSGGIEIDEISKQCKIPKDSAERLMLAAVSAKILIFQEQKFSIEQNIKPFLTKNNPQYCGFRFAHYNETTIKLFQFLEDAVKEDQPQWSKLNLKLDPNNLFNTFYQDTNRTKAFLESMWALGHNDSKELCDQFSFRNFRHLVDIGGATGSFSIPLLLKNMEMTAVIFDKAEVEPYFEEKRTQYKLQDRLSFIAGDFFLDNFPEADLYSLGYILSDWKKDQGSVLLRKIYNALPENGAVVILEKIFNDNLNGPFATAMMNLTMLLETYGKHRSAKEYKNWLKELGFKKCKVIRSSGEKHMIIGYK